MRPTLRSRRLPRLATVGSALLVSGLLLVVHVHDVHADDLAAAKARGDVGERPDGYVGAVRAGAPQSVRTLVADINGQRREHYEKIAKKNGTSTAAVAALAGKKLIERASPGEYVMDRQGRWVQVK